MIIIFLTKPSFSIEFKEHLGSRKWIAKGILADKMDE